MLQLSNFSILALFEPLLIIIECVWKVTTQLFAGREIALVTAPALSGWQCKGIIIIIVFVVNIGKLCQQDIFAIIMAD